MLILGPGIRWAFTAQDHWSSGFCYIQLLYWIFSSNIFKSHQILSYLVKGKWIETTDDIKTTIGTGILREKAKRKLTLTIVATQLRNLVSCCFGTLCIKILLQIFK